ncbi:hypothetical protein FOA43_000915 [Brettanomyces nanus]|uniref:TFIIS central domain-containing protein n=1 Tax=Eeniella nana TaxID=13502 RepID=A0A875RYB6_EENNA|nr:uncharacterized protein FOA43_000915 [Brettanomyces nanus]QPG73603.1 hypothetical protein FOA43_000915 [Brettanomyces nanus]
MARKQKSTIQSINGGISIGDNPKDVWDQTRTACKLGMEKAFFKIIKLEDIDPEEQKGDPDLLTQLYESDLYSRYRTNMSHYKQRFRKDLIAMRNADTEFAASLLSGDMNMEEFCHLKEGELISKKRKKENKMLLERELKKSITKKLPERLSDVPNQNTIVRDKWGISESAAKVDQRFEN